MLEDAHSSLAWIKMPIKSKMKNDQLFVLEYSSKGPRFARKCVLLDFNPHCVGTVDCFAVASYIDSEYNIYTCKALLGKSNPCTCQLG